MLRKVSRVKPLMCFQEMQLERITPNVVTYLCILKACAGIGMITACRATHAEISTKGLEVDQSIGNSLVDMYITCGSHAEAWEVFNTLPLRNVVSWNTLIAGYAESGHGKEAVTFFELMQQDGVLPNAVTFYSTLNAYSGLGMIDKGRGMHAQIIEEGFEGDLLVGSTLVDMYSKGGFLTEAKEVFDSLPLKDVVVWTALIAGFSEKGCGDEAWDLFQAMRVEGVYPDVILWNAVIEGFGTQGRIEESIKCLAQMQEQGLMPDYTIFTSILEASGKAAMVAMGVKVHAVIQKLAVEGIHDGLSISLIEMYCQCGHRFDAESVYHGSTPSLPAWNALLAGYAHLGDSENTLILLERGTQKWDPDEVTLLCVLNAYSHTGLVGKGVNYFQWISEESDACLTNEHCNCIVDMLARAGQLHEAFAIIEKFPFQPDIVTWTILLGACQKWGNAQLGRHAFSHASQLLGSRAAPFVMMSNVYLDICLSHATSKDVATV